MDNVVENLDDLATKRKIIDCFLFFNEVELLKYRLSILDDCVDYFVIVESTTTFTGCPKDLYYNKNKKQFQKYNKKIIHIIVDDMPYIQPSIDFSNNEQWKNEYYQRDAISRAFQILEEKEGEHKLVDEDYIMISDVDEIPDPDTLRQIKEKNMVIKAVRLQQGYYYYNLNTKFISDWYYAVMLSYSHFKSLKISPESCRHAPLFSVLENGGWHLSYFGDVSSIQKKLNSFSHQQYNTELYNTKEHIEECIRNSSDIFVRGKNHEIEILPISENPYLPTKYETFLSRFCIEN